MNKFLFLLFVSTCSIYAQELIVSEVKTITLSPGNSMNVNGLKFSPSIMFEIPGPNSIEKTSTPIVIGSYSSIERVYLIDNTVENFQGTITLHYDESELLGQNELDLVLEFLSPDNIWEQFVPNIDVNNNTLSYTFNSPYNFKTVTASFGNQLNINDINENNFTVYPLPVKSTLNIYNLNEGSNYQLFSKSGKLLFTFNQPQINLESLSSGFYFLVFKDSNGNSKSFKILKE